MKGECTDLIMRGAWLARTWISYLGNLYRRLLGTTGICDRGTRISRKWSYPQWCHFPRYWWTINRGGTLVEWYTRGRSVVHGCWLVLIFDTFQDVLSQQSVCSGLDVMIMVVPMVHTVDEQHIQVPMLLIDCWINEEGSHELVIHSNSSILVWTRGIYDFILSLKFLWMHVTTGQIQI